MENQSENGQNSKLRFRMTSRKISEVIIILLTILVLSWFIISNKTLIGWDFRNNLWAPSYLLLHGQSPYNVKVLYDLGNAVWMPMVIGAFFPLGFLPLQQASNLWLVINFLGIILLTWTSSGFRRPSIFKLTIALVVVFLFPPIISHLRLGQFSIGITLLFLIVTIWNDKLPLILTALLFAIALSKPQLAILVMPGFLFANYRSKGVQNTILLIVFILASTLLLTIPLFIAHPDWYVGFITALQQNPSWQHPSILTVLTSWIGTTGLILYLVLAVVVFFFNIWLWTKLPDRIAVLWSLAFTPLVTPYVWSWDFVMILPLFVSLLFQVNKPYVFWPLLLGYIGCWVLTLRTALGENVSDDQYWWVSWLLMGTIAFVTLVDKSKWTFLKPTSAIFERK